MMHKQSKVRRRLLSASGRAPRRATSRMNRPGLLISMMGSMVNGTTNTFGQRGNCTPAYDNCSDYCSSGNGYEQLRFVNGSEGSMGESIYASIKPRQPKMAPVDVSNWKDDAGAAVERNEHPAEEPIYATVGPKTRKLNASRLGDTRNGGEVEVQHDHTTESNGNWVATMQLQQLRSLSKARMDAQSLARRHFDFITQNSESFEGLGDGPCREILRSTSTQPVKSFAIQDPCGARMFYTDINSALDAAATKRSSGHYDTLNFNKRRVEETVSAQELAGLRAVPPHLSGSLTKSIHFMATKSRDLSRILNRLYPAWEGFQVNDCERLRIARYGILRLMLEGNINESSLRKFRKNWDVPGGTIDGSRVFDKMLPDVFWDDVRVPVVVRHGVLRMNHKTEWTVPPIDDGGMKAGALKIVYDKTKGGITWCFDKAPSPGSRRFQLTNAKGPGGNYIFVVPGVDMKVTHIAPGTVKFSHKDRRGAYSVVLRAVQSAF